MRLTFGFEFSAFHRMWNPDLSDEENRRIFGKCANPNGHGHGYRVEITVAGKVTRESPFVLARSEIARLKQEVLSPHFDCKDLSFLGGNFISSGENLARKIWDVMIEHFPSSPRLEMVKVIETSKNYFSYVLRGGDENDPLKGPCC